MSQGLVALSSVHAVNGMLHALGDFLPVVEASVKAGCGVSSFAQDFILRAFKTDQVLQYSGYDWQTTPRKTEGLASFSLTGQSEECPGLFLKVSRVMREDFEWSRFKALGLTKEFTCNVQERLRYRNTPSMMTSTVLGETIPTLIGMGRNLVSYKVDRGFHLVFKEKLRSPRHLEIYIGGWFDESRFPLAQYEHTRIQKVLRRQG